MTRLRRLSVLALAAGLGALPAAGYASAATPPPPTVTATAGLIGPGQGGPWLPGQAPPRIGTPTVTSTATEAVVTFPLDAGRRATTYRVRAFTFGQPLKEASGTLDGAGSGLRPVTATLTDLVPGVTYGYTIEATNGYLLGAFFAGWFKTAPTGAPPVANPGAPADPAAPAPDAAPAPAGDAVPPPVTGRTVAAVPLKGVVTVRPPGSSTPVDLSAIDGPVPTGSVIDASRGQVALTSALPGGGTQTGRFWGARFTVVQRPKAGMVDLVVDRGLYCPRPRVLSGPPEPRPITAAERVRETARLPRKRVLWGKDSRGKFRTHGRDSVATVRGTIWSTTVTCTATITRVIEGAVAVRDRRTGRTTLVKAGQKYVARRR